MGLSFRLAAVAVNELSKKKKKTKVQLGGDNRRRRRRRGLLKPNCEACGFEKIPEDVFMDILVRLSAKHVTRLKCVSKLWSFLISSRDFTSLFLNKKTPSPPPRRLFVYIVNEEKQSEYALFSSLPNPGSDDISLLDQYIKMQGIGGYMVNALRGLVCFRIGTRLQICNLTTKQHVELPVVTSNIIFPEDNEANSWSYFGHDSVHDEYKVLTTVWEVSKEDGMLRSEHQVLVLGPGAYWRSTQSTIPHCPYSQGFSINGVLYYGAWIGNNNNSYVVMSFDLASEEFTVIKLPVGVANPSLMNYGGKLAVFEYSTISLASDGNVDLWIIEDAGKSLWSSKKSFVLPVSQMNFVSYYHMVMQGTSRRSEVRLACANIGLSQPVHYVTYDLERNKITTRVKINPLRDRFGVSKGLQSDFWEDIETVMYLET